MQTYKVYIINEATQDTHFYMNRVLAAKVTNSMRMPE